MEVRDAVEGDADALAEHVGLPSSAVAQVVHDRTVRVACEVGAPEGRETSDSRAESEANREDERVSGFVAFDAGTDVVHITQLAGDADAVARLLDEPVRFAEHEGMVVEAVVPASDDDLADAVEAYGFVDEGAGPRFEGEATRRYRLAT